MVEQITLYTNDVCFWSVSSARLLFANSYNDFTAKPFFALSKSTLVMSEYTGAYTYVLVDSRLQ